MERNPSVPDAVVIDQDDQTQIHIQAAIQSGRRHLDIRIWRHGPSGFAPSRTGLAVEGADLGALQQGIAELLEASEGGKHVARVVWDGEDGRRLRAEVEPFGARHVARLGFWQRVRNTWRPVDDGLVLASDLLMALQGVLARFDPWLTNGNGQEVQHVAIGTAGQSLDRWPPPGADWLTVEPDRVAFHPRGVRITCMITEQDERHAIALRQWKRRESLWLPERACALPALDLDRLLCHLPDLSEKYERGDEVAEIEIPCADGSTLRVGYRPDDSEGMLRVEQRQPDHPNFEPRLVLPTVYLSRLGRALAQCWLLLAPRLSEAEREELRVAEVEPAPESPEEPPVTLEVAESSEELSPNGQSPESPTPPSHTESAPVIPKTFPFGEESETPGMVIRDEQEVRLVVEGFMLPHSIALPLEVLAGVVTCLEELNALRQQHGHVDPILLCDRPDCALYGRIGTRMHPEAAELRVWTGPSTSEFISFEAVYLPELIDGLRQSLAAAGRPVPEPRTATEAPTPPAACRSESTMPRAPVVVNAAVREEPPVIAAPRSVPLGAIELGHQYVALSVRGRDESSRLVLQWEDNTLELPTGHLEELLSDIRALYYDALRGRRGQTLAIGRHPTVVVAVRNQGPQMCLVLQYEIDGEGTSLSVASGDVPAFLNALRCAVVNP